jgi:Concanavalin A-like lectin/glucanases superfamily
MATAPTLFWYQIDSGTLAATYFGQLNATVAALCSEQSITAPTAPWQNSIGGTLHSKWMTQIDTAVRSLCTALSVAEPLTLRATNAGQYQSKYMESLDDVVRALCSAYHADAVHFDNGVGGDRLGIASLSCVDGPVSMSFWVRFAANPANGAFIWGSDVDGAGVNSMGVYDSPANNVRINLSDGGGNTLQFLSSVTAALDTWYNVLISADTNHASGARFFKIYLNDVDVTQIVLDAGAAFTTPLNGFTLDLGNVFDSDGAAMDMADFWFAPNVSLLIAGDIPEATRRLFISATGKPVDPSGFPAAAILFSGDATAFVTNQGLGGTFTLTGSLTDASTSPSD